MASSIRSQILAVISLHDLETFDTQASATISDAQHLASYSWLNTTQPTIALPGSPARWSPPFGPQRVKKDSGLIFIAQNAARHPQSPYEPLFRALYAEQPSFDINGVDIVTDRDSLRKLLSFVYPGSSKGRESFSIDLEVNNTTVIFCRKDRATKEYIGPNDFQGYGHEFEKAYTSETTPNSTGHHRIITYQFGGMRYLVRYETDGYVDDTAATATQSGKINDSDDLASLLSSLSLTLAGSSSAQKVTAITGSRLRMKMQGHKIPPQSTLEMKTRAAHRRLALTEVASQLWFSQTPKLVRAYHDQGVFQDPIVEDVTDDIEKLEDTHQEQLRKLAALIGRILQVVKEHGGPATIKYEKGKGHKLTLYAKPGGKKILPQDLYTKWNKEGGSGKLTTNTQRHAEN